MASIPKAQHSRTRTSSNAAQLTRPDSKASRRPTTALAEPQIHYNILIRLPFPRGDFVDPAQVEWDATKDQALWKIISKNAKTSELNWQELATRFEVPQSFLLQQAAWLYERHLSHVRAQMRKVGSSSTGTPVSAGTGSGTVSAQGGGPMKGAAGTTGLRTPSALSIRSRDSPVPSKGGIGSVPGTPVIGAPTLSRTPSTTTVTQSRLMQQQPQSPRQPLRSSFRSSFPPPRRTSPTLEPTAEASHPHSSTASPESPGPFNSDSSSASSGDESDNPIRRSQLFKRTPRFRSRPKKPALGRLDDEDYDDSNGSGPGPQDSDDDDDGAFLPFAQPARRVQQQPNQDPSATLREQPDSPSVPTRSSTNPDARHRPLSSIAAGKQPMRAQTIDSSATSASDLGSVAQHDTMSQGEGASPDPREGSQATSAASPSQQPVTGAARQVGLRGGDGPLSPRHRAELARLGSPRGRREGSEGTPSMGSSFSDLDDASVTQSALEEQLLSHMQQAGMSKMSTISKAFGSRYL